MTDYLSTQSSVESKKTKWLSTKRTNEE